MPFFRKLFGANEESSQKNKPEQIAPYKYELGVIFRRHTGISRQYSRSARNGRIIKGIEIDFLDSKDGEIRPLSFEAEHDAMGASGDSIIIVLARPRGQSV